MSILLEALIVDFILLTHIVPKDSVFREAQLLPSPILLVYWFLGASLIFLSLHISSDIQSFHHSISSLDIKKSPNRTTSFVKQELWLKFNQLLACSVITRSFCYEHKLFETLHQKGVKNFCYALQYQPSLKLQDSFNRTQA